MDSKFKGNGHRQGKMKHKVQFYDIEHDATQWAEFETYEAAKRNAEELKKFFLNRTHPAPVFIDVMPV